MEGTNVIDEDLTSTTGWRGDSTSWAAVASAAKATSAWTSFVTSARGWASEPWFGLAILDEIDEYSIQEIRRNALGVISLACRTYLANVDKSAHEILIGKCVDCLLGLLPCGVFHNPDFDQLKQCISWSRVTYPHPYITRGQCPNPSIQRSNNQKKTKKTSHSTYWRPPSTFHSEVIGHPRKEPPQLYIIASVEEDDKLSKQEQGISPCLIKSFK